MNNPFIEDIKSQYKNGSALIKLIFVNIAVFLLVSLLHVVFLLFNVDELFNFYSNGERAFKLTIWLSANSDIVELLQKPWSIITYMFLHENFMHILFNMIMLYFSGRLFTQYLSDKKLVTTYLLGGISGLIFYVLAYNLFPFFKYPAGIPIMGASASVMAVLIAIATYAPQLKIRLVFIGEVKLMYVAAFFVILDILNLKGGLNEGG